MAYREKKGGDDEGGDSNPYANLEKSRVLQEARKFNETPINVKKCAQILTKIVYLIMQGETIATTEATDAFFAATKLFQSSDTMLRNLLYLTIKEMAPFAENVIIVTSSLTKDMTGKLDAVRAPALRALCRITDASMLQGIERYLKQALVDKSPAVAAAALVSALHLVQNKDSLEAVKRWAGEVTQTLSAKGNLVQYHALGVLYHSKAKDRLAVAKLVATTMKAGTVRAPHATMLLVRYAAKMAEQDSDPRPFLDYIESCLRNRSELVVYEAARTLVALPGATARDISAAVAVLQVFLSSPKATLRFAVIKTLNRIAIAHAGALKACHLDMENLVTDANRSIATLAITTLLKTGSEQNIDRLMKQIGSFLGEISDEFKIVVVDAIRALCLKFPAKHGVLMGFLAGVLRDEGGFEYKRAVVDTIVAVVQHVPEAREAGLGHLCEFIEDCEYTTLLVKILHIVGREGPTATAPRRFVRFIYNRLILENATVRAAAVQALARFGAVVAALRPSVLVLLRRCLADGDDEVRDRATLYVDLLERDEQDHLLRQLAVGDAAAAAAAAPAGAGAAAQLLVNAAPLAPAGLVRALDDYVAAAAGTAQPFDLALVPFESPAAGAAGAAGAAAVSPTGLADVPAAGAAGAVSGSAAVGADGGSAAAAGVPGAAPSAAVTAQLAAVPQFAAFGPPLKSTAAVPLTESETEYVVTCVKHLYARHVVFQFSVTNTLNDQVLEQAQVVMEGGSQELDENDVVMVPAAKLVYGTPGFSYVAFPLDPSVPSQAFAAHLDFVVKDCDPETGECDEEGYEDTYTLEGVTLQVADLMRAVDKPNFAAAWDELAHGAEKVETFELSTMHTLDDAVAQITRFLGMAPCEKSNKAPADKSTHTLVLSGVYPGGHAVLARAKLALDRAVTLQLTVRSADEATAAIVAAAIGG